jgi:hypothetical protein
VSARSWDLEAGPFDEKLFALIERIPNFIALLTRGCLDDDRRGDWFRKEIVHALNAGRTIVPVIMPGFQWPEPQSIPTDLRRLPAHQYILYSPEYFEAMVERLVRYLHLEARRR